MAGRKYSNQTGKRKPLTVTVKSRKTGMIDAEKSLDLNTANRISQSDDDVGVSDEVLRHVSQGPSVSSFGKHLNRATRATIKARAIRKGRK